MTSVRMWTRMRSSFSFLSLKKHDCVRHYLRTWDKANVSNNDAKKLWMSRHDTMKQWVQQRLPLNWSIRIQDTISHNWLWSQWYSIQWDTNHAMNITEDSHHICLNRMSILWLSNVSFRQLHASVYVIKASKSLVPTILVIYNLLLLLFFGWKRISST